MVRAGKSFKILIIDNDRANQELYREYLSRFALLLACDADQARTFFNDNPDIGVIIIEDPDLTREFRAAGFNGSMIAAAYGLDEAGEFSDTNFDLKKAGCDIIIAKIKGTRHHWNEVASYMALRLVF